MGWTRWTRCIYYPCFLAWRCEGSQTSPLQVFLSHYTPSSCSLPLLPHLSPFYDCFTSPHFNNKVTTWPVIFSHNVMWPFVLSQGGRVPGSALRPIFFANRRVWTNRFLYCWKYPSGELNHCNLIIVVSLLEILCYCILNSFTAVGSGSAKNKQNNGGQPTEREYISNTTFPWVTGLLVWEEKG